ncbi:hypothetical protein M9Y10_019314 [Tritrichomonas musculus]|uniref:Uncharacterized protein n=1 Tax=Tritrichomonas musculus TaxID=1915356 RepID=A0ABR2HJ71_9EUKA
MSYQGPEIDPIYQDFWSKYPDPMDDVKSTNSLDWISKFQKSDEVHGEQIHQKKEDFKQLIDKLSDDDDDSPLYEPYCLKDRKKIPRLESQQDLFLGNLKLPAYKIVQVHLQLIKSFDT